MEIKKPFIAGEKLPFRIHQGRRVLCADVHRLLSRRRSRPRFFNQYFDALTSQGKAMQQARFLLDHWVTFR
jgi:hypothetical protein